MKSHKIPTDIDDPTDWLVENGFPVRSIISSIGSPTERLGGFVDHFLQPGMRNLPSFLEDTKHTLQIIEDVNSQIDSGTLSLDDVALVSMDIVSMYPNMSEEVGVKACKSYLESRDFRDLDDEYKISTQSCTQSCGMA